MTKIRLTLACFKMPRPSKTDVAQQQPEVHSARAFAFGLDPQDSCVYCCVAGTEGIAVLQLVPQVLPGGLCVFVCFCWLPFILLYSLWHRKLWLETSSLHSHQEIMELAATHSATHNLHLITLTGMAELAAHEQALRYGPGLSDGPSIDQRELDMDVEGTGAALQGEHRPLTAIAVS